MVWWKKRIKKKDQIFQFQYDLGYTAEPQNSFKFVCKLYVNGIFTMTVNARTRICKASRQKQPSIGVLRKRCSENMQQIYMRKPSQSVVSIKLLCNFIETTLQHGCSPVNLLQILRTYFHNSTYGRLLLSRSRLQW